MSWRRPTKAFNPVTFSTTPPPLARALAERNYDQATPVQTAVLADAAAERDLLVSAQTGSGKTVAYGLAIAGLMCPPVVSGKRSITCCTIL